MNVRLNWMHSTSVRFKLCSVFQLSSSKSNLIDSDALESAKRCVIFELINRQNSIFDVISQAVLLKMQNLPEDYNK